MNTDNIMALQSQHLPLKQSEGMVPSPTQLTVTTCTNIQTIPGSSDSAGQTDTHTLAHATSKPYARLLAERGFPEGYLEAGPEKTAEILNLFEYIRWSRNSSNGYLLISVKFAPDTKEEINLKEACNILKLSSVEEGSHFAITYENDRLYFTRPQTVCIDPHKKRKPPVTDKNHAGTDISSSLEGLMKMWGHKSCDNIYRFYIPRGVKHDVMKCLFTEMEQHFSRSLQPEKILLGHVMKSIVHYLKSETNWLSDVQENELTAQHFPLLYDMMDLLTDNVKSGF